MKSEKLRIKNDNNYNNSNFKRQKALKKAEQIYESCIISNILDENENIYTYSVNLEDVIEIDKETQISKIDNEYLIMLKSILLIMGFNNDVLISFFDNPDFYNNIYELNITMRIKNSDEKIKSVANTIFIEMNKKLNEVEYTPIIKKLELQIECNSIRILKKYLDEEAEKNDRNISLNVEDDDKKIKQVTIILSKKNVYNNFDNLTKSRKRIKNK